MNRLLQENLKKISGLWMGALTGIPPGFAQERLPGVQWSAVQEHRTLIEEVIPVGWIQRRLYVYLLTPGQRVVVHTWNRNWQFVDQFHPPVQNFPCQFGGFRWTPSSLETVLFCRDTLQEGATQVLIWTLPKDSLAPLYHMSFPYYTWRLIPSAEPFPLFRGFLAVSLVHPSWAYLLLPDSTRWKLHEFSLSSLNAEIPSSLLRKLRSFSSPVLRWVQWGWLKGSRQSTFVLTYPEKMPMTLESPGWMRTVSLRVLVFEIDSPSLVIPRMDTTLRVLGPPLLRTLSDSCALLVWLNGEGRRNQQTPFLYQWKLCSGMPEKFSSLPLPRYLDDEKLFRERASLLLESFLPRRDGGIVIVLQNYRFETVVTGSPDLFYSGHFYTTSKLAFTGMHIFSYPGKDSFPQWHRYLSRYFRVEDTDWFQYASIRLYPIGASFLIILNDWETSGIRTRSIYVESDGTWVPFWISSFPLLTGYACGCDPYSIVIPWQERKKYRLLRMFISSY